MALVDKSRIQKGLRLTPRNAINKSSKKKINGESLKAKEKQRLPPNIQSVVGLGLNNLGIKLSPIVL